MKAMSSYPEIDALFCDFLNINNKTQEKYRTFEEYANALKLLKVQQVVPDLHLVRAGILESLAVENYIATDTIIVRREILEKVGLFNEELRNSEDFELWWRMGLAGVCFAYINRVLLTRYKPSGSLSGHSQAACDNHLHAMDLCVKSASSSGRPELIPELKPQYRNTWQHLITSYAQTGNRIGMFSAFRQSLRYGFRLGSVRLLLQGICRSIMILRNRDGA
jgi:hypothetical protein